MKRVIRNYVSEPSCCKHHVCPLTRPPDTLSKSGEGNKADCSVCGKILMQTLCLHLSWICSTLTGEGRLTGRGTKSVILNSFQDLSFPQSIPHPNPVLDLLHAHGDSTKSLRLSSLVPFAIRTYFVSSVRKSASYLGEGIQVYTKADC